MTRVVLTDDSGKWFDDDKAVKFSEDTWHNGSNYISRATSSQWEHQALYYTKGGAWVLHAWSQYQGVPESYDQIQEEEAIQWLISQKCFEDDGLDDLPVDVIERVNCGIADAEL